MEVETYTITKASFYLGVTRQAVYIAIKYKKLKATMINGHWIITLKELEEWNINKYNRNLRISNGMRLFNEKTTFSVSQAAKLLSVPEQRIYYLLRTGDLECFLIEKTKVIKLEHINAYLEKHPTLIENAVEV